jgi:hypothetical protein
MVVKQKNSLFIPIFALLLMILGCNAAQKQEKAESEGGEETEAFGGNPEFEALEHNFGMLGYGEEVGARFGYKNNGEGLLMIERVVTGCGCTVAEYSEKPLKPGETGFVEVIFDSRGKRGSQFQEARVFFRGHKTPVRLSIFAEVGKN